MRNHAQCFTLNTSGKYHCCFRIKDLNAVSNPKFFHGFETAFRSLIRKQQCYGSNNGLDRDMTIFRDFQGPRRDIGMARPRHSKTCLETETRLEASSSVCPPPPPNYFGLAPSLVLRCLVFTENIGGEQ